MRHTIFTMVALLVSAAIHAQINGIVLDAETLTPLSEAIVYYQEDGTNTGDDGKFQLNANDGSFKVSLLGYDAEEVKLQAGKQYYKVLLSKQYTDLTEVEIKTKRLTVEDIMNKAIDSIKVNYVDGGTILSGKHHMVLIEGADTVAYISKPVYYKGKKNKWLHQDRYRVKGQLFTKHVYTDTAVDELKDYMTNYAICLNDLKRSFKDIAGSSGQKVFISTFMQDGQLFYDLVFVSVDSSKPQYNLAAQAMGYGGKHNANARKTYVSITEVKVNTRNFAVENYQWFSIASSDEDVKRFLQIDSRNALTQWMRPVGDVDRKYMYGGAFFGYNKNGKLFLNKEYFFDNLLHPTYKNKEKPIRNDVTFISAYMLQEFGKDQLSNSTYYSPRLQVLFELGQ